MAVAETKILEHEIQCASRWGLLIKIIVMGGGAAFTIILGVAGWGLNRVYEAQQQQAHMLEQVLYKR